MNQKVVITGLGQLSAMGQGIEFLKKASSPTTTIRKIKTARGEVEIQTLSATEVILPNSIPDGVARRMSRLSKMCFAAVDEALNDAFKKNERDPERIGLVVGTAYGALDTANEFNERVQLEGLTGASPSLFASSVQNSIASHLSITFNLQGPAATVMTMEQTAFGSLRLAYDWLLQGLVDHVVVVIGDEISHYHTYFMSDVVTDGSLNYKSDQCTARLGEGAVCFILSKEGQEPNLKKYASLTNIDLNCVTPLNAKRILMASTGQQEQYSQYKSILKNEGELQSHVQFYGSMLTGAAFEVAFAALKISQDQIETSCLQLTNERNIQALHLK